MTFKANGTTIVDSNRAGNFENVYYQYTSNTITGNSQYSVNSSVWLTDSGNASFTMLFANTAFLEYTQAQGASYGYTSGGSNDNDPLDTIDRFPFAVATTNATNVGNLINTKNESTGCSSSTHGYDISGTYYLSGFAFVDSGIDRFPFALESSITVSDVGNLPVYQQSGAGQSSSTHGYVSGGADPNSTYDVIQRFPFASSSTNGTDVGNLSIGKIAPTGQSSTTHGYTSGGTDSTLVISNVIDRFPFASTTTNATDVGDLTVARTIVSGQSSSTHGYTSGGNIAAGPQFNVIDRFPFASATVNATDVGDLTVARNYIYGQSSVSHGYNSGGYSDPTGALNVIDRFPYSATTVNATDVGDLSGVRGYGSSQQV